MVKSPLSCQEDTVKDVEIIVASRGGEGTARAKFRVILACTLHFPASCPPPSSSPPHLVPLPRRNLPNRDLVDAEGLSSQKRCSAPTAQPRLCLHGVNCKRCTRPTHDARYGQATAVKPLTLSHGAQIGALVHGHTQPRLLAAVYAAAHRHCVGRGIAWFACYGNFV